MRPFIKGISNTPAVPVEERARTVTHSLKEIKNALYGKLSLDDNLQSFVAEVVIDSGATVRVRNELSAIPTEWVVVDSLNAPVGAVARANINWDQEYLYLQNTSVYSGTFKIRFYAGKSTDRQLKNNNLVIDTNPSTSNEPTYAEVDGDSGQTIPNQTTGYTTPTIGAVVEQNGGISVSSDLFTMPVGTYLLIWHLVDVVSTANNGVYLRVYNITTGTPAKEFQKVQLEANINGTFTASMLVRITSSTDEYALQWRTETATTASAQAASKIIFVRLGGAPLEIVSLPPPLGPSLGLAHL